ncbi:MAG: DUF5685 family protein [Oscillospiraceae bacterium]|nr:DUF5685 family protein [Oscillospiraceae bacterium]MDD3260686.1 DUF5685 family protein [Oscillospiraceae bacterium]
MFGYIRPQKPELLVREYETYHAVYCGICKALGQQYGFFSRILLSYDSTFYALLLLSLQKDCCPGFQKGRCVVYPLKKCVYCTGAEEPLQQAAALCVLLSVQKLRDDRRDRGRAARLRAVFLLPLLHHSYRKAAKNYPWMEQAVRSCMQQQSAAEKQPQAGLDACAQPTAEMLSQILSHAVQKKMPAQQRIMQETGFFLGRWIYLMDAADDLQKDAKSGDFNWFVFQYGVTPDSTEEELQKVREKANASLNLTMSRLYAAFNLLPLNRFASILRNIVEQGLPQMQKQLLFKQKEKE